MLQREEEQKIESKIFHVLKNYFLSSILNIIYAYYEDRPLHFHEDDTEYSLAITQLERLSKINDIQHYHEEKILPKWKIDIQFSSKYNNLLLIDDLFRKEENKLLTITVKDLKNKIWWRSKTWYIKRSLVRGIFCDLYFILLSILMDYIPNENLLRIFLEYYC